MVPEEGREGHAVPQRGSGEGAVQCYMYCINILDRSVSISYLLSPLTCLIREVFGTKPLIPHHRGNASI